MRTRRALIATCLLGLAAAVGIPVLVARAATTPVAKLTWYGQSCFLLETSTGTRVVIDPIPGNIGYTLPTDLKADVVTVSHEHGDHNNVALVQGKPKILRGLTADKKGWVKIDEKVKDVAIRSVGVYHDEEKGAKRGLNTVFLYEVGGVRIAHLGDLGHVLNDQQLAAIGAVDVLLVPVGGTFTIDGLTATHVVEQLRPRIMVIPMHYKTDASTIKELEPLALFLDGKRNVRHESSNTIAISPMKARPAAEIVVLNYR